MRMNIKVHGGSTLILGVWSHTYTHTHTHTHTPTHTHTQIHTHTYTNFFLLLYVEEKHVLYGTSLKLVFISYYIIDKTISVKYF